jgi:hypothetical protein
MGYIRKKVCFSSYFVTITASLGTSEKPVDISDAIPL